MSASVTPPQTELLTSWKEIACYLGKGVRTVQRWEQQFGLPVRRPNEKVKGIVHATREDLDRWLEMQWSQRPKETAYTARAEDMEGMRARIRQSAALRNANRRLLTDMRDSVRAMFEACQVLARNISGTAPPTAKE